MLRPWPAADGALVRVRLVGGRIAPASLRALGEIARTHGDGDLHLTGRANLQLRGLPADVPVTAFEAAGVLPSRRHDLARNLLVSPATGIDPDGGRADLRPVAAELDRLLLASPRAADLPGRFLFVLDDGRGDLLDRPVDLGLVALDATHAQVRIGTRVWGGVLPLTAAPGRLVELAHRFLELRGPGADAAWHVAELDPDTVAALAGPAASANRPDPRLPAASPPPPYGVVAGGTHVAAPDGVLSPDLLAELLASAPPEQDLVITPWRGVLVAS